MLNMQEKLAPIYNQRSIINIFFFNYLIGGLSKAVAQRLRRKQGTLWRQSDSFMHL